jgi:murein DD-endopeptidase MepM/ murein hydrolase activator NlpD
MPLAEVFENGHREKSGQWVEYEQIPRRPERPESYSDYRYPVDGALMVSGYDLDKPDVLQRRGKMNAVGHGGVDLGAPVDSPVVMFSLTNQVGDAEVLHAGWLFGETVVTRHTVLEGGHKHDYLVLFGHLDVVAPDVRRGQHLRDGDLVGFVGNSGSPEFVHLHLEVRRGRDGTDLWTVPGELLNAREYSIVTDPRNMLPLNLTPPHRASKCLLLPRTPAPRHRLGDDLGLKVELPWATQESVSGALRELHPFASGYVYSPR